MSGRHFCREFLASDSPLQSSEMECPQGESWQRRCLKMKESSHKGRGVARSVFQNKTEKWNRISEKRR